MGPRRVTVVHTRTTTALLDDLADPSNDAAWSELDGRFRPIVFGLARRLGLAEPDAADATQEALTRFVRSYRDGRYDRSRGRLQAWMIGIARHAIAQHRIRIASSREHAGGSVVHALPDESETESAWNDVVREELLRRAMLRLRTMTNTDARTIEAFELLCLRQLDVPSIASRLGMTRNDVYLAKHRCLSRLRELMEEDRGMLFG